MSEHAAEDLQVLEAAMRLAVKYRVEALKIRGIEIRLSPLSLSLPDAAPIEAPRGFDSPDPAATMPPDDLMLFWSTNGDAEHAKPTAPQEPT